MAKAPKAVKWSIGADEPDDLDDFLSNDDIVARNTSKKTKEVKWPPKGPHTFKVVQARIKPNKNGDDRIAVMLSLQAGKGDPAQSWNGYVIWDGFNVVDGPSLKFLKRWLKALGLEWSDFVNKSKQDDQDPPHLVQIGRVKIEGGSKPATLKATVKVKDADDYNDDEHMEIASYLPLDDDEPEDEPEDDEDEDDAEDEFLNDDEDSEDEDEDEDEDEEDDDEEDEDDDEEDEDEDDEDDEDDEEEEEDEDDLEAQREELTAELKSLSKADLQKRAVRVAKKAKPKIDPDDLPAKKSDLVDWLVEQELPPF
jgi:hypothetical protein